MSNFFTVKQIAERLGYAESTVLSLIHNGSLNAIKPTTARTYRISEEDFQAFVKVAGQRSRKVKP